MMTASDDAAPRRRELEDTRTQIAELERELAETRSLVSLGRLTLSIAHDFRNVMAVITGQSELVLESVSADGPLRRRLQAIRKATGWGERLTRELLAAGRVPSSSAPIAGGRVSVTTSPAANVNGARGGAATGPTVLVLEEEAGVRELIVDILELHEFCALPARDHGEAERVSAAHAGPLALVITAAGSGAGAARRLDILRAARPETRVLYLSSRLEDARLARTAGATLAKPFTVEGLVRKVREVLGAATG